MVVAGGPASILYLFRSAGVKQAPSPSLRRWPGSHGQRLRPRVALAGPRAGGRLVYAAGVPSPRIPFVGLRFVADFECIGAACEESCCQVGWQIPIDEAHFRRLRRAVGEAEFSRLVSPLPPAERSRARHGLLVLDERGACLQLDPQGLCGTQAGHGPEVLSDTCALYPRMASMLAGRRELQMVLSCPEVARLALLRSGATDLVELSSPLFPAARKDAIRRLPADTDPWVRRLDDVRGTAYELLSRRVYPVKSRLAFTLALSSALSEFFYPGSDRYTDLRFDEVLLNFSTDGPLDALHREVVRGRGDEVFPAHFVLELLRARLGQPASASFLDAALTALGGCQDPSGKAIEVRGGPAHPPTTLTVSAASLLDAHERRVRGLPWELAARLELYLENFTRAYWITHWYLSAPSLVAFAQVVALRVAVLRFLLLGHGRTDEARRALGAGLGAEAERLFDEAVVECAFGMTRAIEHQDQLVDGVMQTFERERLTGLFHGLALVRF